MSLPEALRWHAGAWRLLEEGLASGTLHHAMLLSGPPGVGKRRFAERAAAALLCEGQLDAPPPCGRCRSCRLSTAGSHPDRLDLRPAEARSVIDVDQVRERIEALALTPHYGQRRVVVVNPADALNRHAANTLLKTLEEPPGLDVFLLVTDRPSRLPQTVRSRCSLLRFGPPDPDEGTTWVREQLGDQTLDVTALLAWCSGAPLAALEAARGGALERRARLLDELNALIDSKLDPLAAAARWRKEGLALMVEWQLRVAVAAMRVCVLGAEKGADPAIQSIGRSLDLPRAADICEELLELRDALDRQLNPNETLALESLAIAWQSAGPRASRTGESQDQTR